MVGKTRCARHTHLYQCQSTELTDPEAESQEAEEELTPAAAREKERIENIWSNAARLAEAGVTFAITSGGGDADLREAAMKSMEYGLSESAALRAITSVPATILGIPSVPQVGQGMAATFVAMTLPQITQRFRLRPARKKSSVDRTYRASQTPTPSIASR